MRALGACALLFVLHGCFAVEGDEKFSTTTQLSLVGTIADLKPVGYWRLGDLSGSTMHDIGPNSVHGEYKPGVMLGHAGAIPGDRDKSIFVQGTWDSFGVIPDRKMLSLTRAWDTFNRPFSGYSSSWGTAPDGQVWVPRVSFGAYYATDSGRALVNPNGAAGAWQQGLPTSQLDGDMQVRANWTTHASGGPLQPVSLVAQYVNNSNFVRAELVENTNHTLDLKIVAMANGVGITLATAQNIGTYNTNDWWYIRFQFNGPVYRARAWKRGTPQPLYWQVNATAATASVGTIGIRTANSQSSSRPIVRFESFWTQTLGLSIHMFLKIHPEQSSCGEPIYLFGKGEEGGLDGNREYLLRYHPTTDCGGDPNCNPAARQLKAYVNDWTGGLGAGRNFGCSTLGCSPALEVHRWYQLVITLDSGDALDSEAGISFYVDGVPISSDGVASKYNASRQCIDATSCDPNALPPNENCAPNACGYDSALPAPGGGTLSPNECQYKVAYYGGNVGSCWNLYPMSGDADLRLGSRDPAAPLDNFFTGWFDELAIFSRKLTLAEVQELQAAAQ